MVPLALDLLCELEQEAAVTRRYLALVPFEQADYKPHSKSESLGRLAIHIAEILSWWKSTLQQNELDYLGFTPANIQCTQGLLNYFDTLLEEAKSALRSAKEEDFDNQWTLRYGPQVIFSLPKKEVVRKFCLNHFVHHRAQLGVYFRILDIPLPSTYGPSADDNEVILTEPYMYSKNCSGGLEFRV